jgi:putative OPT family oligopeptide transporter
MSQKTQTDYREITFVAIALGFVQGVILNVAFVYTALKLGFSLGGSTLAAILGYVFLRIVLKRSSIIENNLNQTIASGINSAGFGVVFVFPALFLLGLHEQPDFSIFPLVLAALAGSLLGVLLIIPLRRQFIERQRLRFPTGVAVATVLRSGGAGVDKARLLFVGVIISATWKLFMLSGWLDIPGILVDEELNFGLGLIPLYFAPVLYLSMMNFAAGLLSGRAGLPFFIGGILAWWILSPSVVYLEWIPPQLQFDEAALTAFIYQNMLRPLGIGMLIGAAAMELVRNLPLLKNTWYFLCHCPHRRVSDKEELPLTVLLIGITAALILMFIAAWYSAEVSWMQALLIAVLGTLWLGLGAIIVTQASGLTDISPISGLTLVSMIIMLFLLDSSIPAAFMLTLAVAVAVGLSADMMQDLKTGFLVGSRPFTQQLLQFTTAWVGVLLAFATIYILWHSGAGGAHGFGPGSALPAPQAGALSGIVATISSGDVPLDKYILGGLMGFVFAAAPIGGLGVLVGLAMYLPFAITLGYGLGCLAQMGLERTYGQAFSENKIVPLAAGLIIGEALMGVAHALYAISHAT